MRGKAGRSSRAVGTNPRREERFPIVKEARGVSAAGLFLKRDE
jgi:hypothetical protein